MRDQKTGSAKTLVIKDDTPDAKLFVVDDAGNGFRDDKSISLRAPCGVGKTTYRYFKDVPSFNDWATLEVCAKIHAERLVVVISADDLRSWD